MAQDVFVFPRKTRSSATFPATSRRSARRRRRGRRTPVAKAEAKMPPRHERFSTRSWSPTSPIPRHAGRRAHRLHARSRLPRRVPVHARRPADDVPRPPLDHAHVRGLRHAGADEHALQVPPRARSDGPLDRFRFPHADGLRQRLAAFAWRGRHVRRRGRHAARHGDPLRRHPARQGDDVDDHQRSGDRAPRVLRRARRHPRHPAHGDRRHGAERLPQGVHRAAARGSSRRARRCAS